MVKTHNLDFISEQNDNINISIYDANLIVQGSIVELTGGASPFEINYDCESSVISSNATLTIVSTTDREFLHMVDRDRFRWVIKVLKNSENMWEGYIDTESYSENFNEDFNYDISFDCSDGLALLDRVRVDELGLDFNNLNSTQTLLEKIANFYISLSSAVEGNSAISIDVGYDSSTIVEFLSAALLNPSNFIDEDGEYMFCADMLSSIFSPIRNKVFRSNVGITYFNENDIKYNTPLIQGVDFEYYSTGQELSIIPATNEHVLNYDSYRTSSIVLNKTEGSNYLDSDRYDDGSTDGLAKYSQLDRWEIVTNSGHYFGRFIDREDDGSTSQYNNGFFYIKKTQTDSVGNTSTIPAFRYTSVLPCYSIADGATLTFKGRVKPYILSGTFPLTSIGVIFKVTLENNGHKVYLDSKFDGKVGSWSPEPYVRYYTHRFGSEDTLTSNGGEDFNDISAEGFSSAFETYIPMDRFPVGKLTFEIMEGFNIKNDNNGMYTYEYLDGSAGHAAVEGLILEDLNVTIKDSYPEDTPSTEYKIFDSSLKYKDSEKTTLYCGTHQSGMEMGQFIYNAVDTDHWHFPITEVKYDTTGVIYSTVEDYFLQTIFQDKSTSRLLISGVNIDSLDVYPNNIITLSSVQGKIFKINSISKSLYSGSSMLTIEEIIV